MKRTLKSKSDFSRNVLTLMTGTTVAQAIPIAISPILTRVYTPEDFGVVALFMAIVVIFGTIINARYELAIVLPKDDRDAINIVALGLLINSLLVILLFVFIVIFHDNIVLWLKSNAIGVWLYFVPLTVFFVGLFNVLNYYNTRKKYYKDIASSKIIKSIVLAIVQLLGGFIKQGATGLVSGQIISQIVANWRLIKNIINDKMLLSNISLERIVKVFKEYINFPKFSLGATLANILSKQMLNILITLFYNLNTLGFYTLVQKILGLPSALIGGSMGQVFFQMATEEKNQIGNIKRSYLKTIRNAILIAITVFGILYFSVEEIFYCVFGSSWKIAGVYAKIVIPFFAIRFIYATVSTTYSIFNKLKLELIWQLSMLIGILIIFYYSRELPFIEFLHNLNLFLVITYLFSLYLTYNLAFKMES